MAVCGNHFIKVKYSHYFTIVKVKKLKQRRQSAGNFINLRSMTASLIINQSTSETLRCNSISSENIKQISIHVPLHIKPENDLDFGHYLAGLIDGDGHFSKALQLIIIFNELDSSLAYLIKKKIGYGNVYKVKNKKAVILVISNRIGLLKILNLINGKIRSESKLNQIYDNILTNSYFKSIFYNDAENLKLFTLNLDVDLNNYWLSGFSDADASFQIKLINRNNKTEVRLNFQVDQKKKDLLILIKNYLGGNIGYRKNQDTYYYGSTSFGSAKKVILYFDRFHLLSTKHNNYLKWRKAYILIQRKDHFTESGFTKIMRLKKTMNKNNSEEIE